MQFPSEINQFFFLLLQQPQPQSNPAPNKSPPQQQTAPQQQHQKPQQNQQQQPATGEFDFILTYFCENVLFYYGFWLST